jgi:anti-sigma factor RsiW
MRPSISLRLDGELSDLGQRRLARHLAHCDACAQFARSLTLLTETLRHANRVQPQRPI